MLCVLISAQRFFVCSFCIFNARRHGGRQQPHPGVCFFGGGRDSRRGFLARLAAVTAGPKHSCCLGQLRRALYGSSLRAPRPELASGSLRHSDVCAARFDDECAVVVATLIQQQTHYPPGVFETQLQSIADQSVAQFRQEQFVQDDSLNLESGLPDAAFDTLQQ